jgi:hypothetical protein
MLNRLDNVFFHIIAAICFNGPVGILLAMWIFDL